MAHALRLSMALAAIIAATPANAITVSVVDEDFYASPTFPNPPSVDISPYAPFLTAPDLVNTTGVVNEGVAGSTGTMRSPWQLTKSGATEFGDTGLYTSVQGGAYGEMIFDSLKSTLRMAWGSPDYYNTLTFYNDVLGESQSITSTALANFTAFPSHGVNFVTIFVLGGFDRISWASTSEAFEFANVLVRGGPGDLTPAPVPLPAGLMLLLSGLMGLGFLGRARAKAA
jgi:hypothetical protein